LNSQSIEERNLNMPMTKVESEHDQLISMLKQLVDEREILSRENEYLKAKLNESILMETIKELKKERDLLFKLLSNLTINQK
jgi:regulator of replication initiation timing